MPELPEVETIKLGLQKYLVGHRIEEVEVRLKKQVTGDTSHVTGAKVIDVRRFGKGLVIDLDNGYSLAIHIKLTGQLIYTDPNVAKIAHVSQRKVGTIPNAFTHVIFHLDESAKLYYNDQRQFGWIKIVASDKIKDLSFFKTLGPEFFKDLTEEKFATIVKKSGVAIKPLLLDQQKMSGVGNIYANDALFDAKIDPRRKAKELSEAEIKTLFVSLLKVLKKGLATGGASELQFVNALGEDGGYQKHFKAYAQQGKKCERCGGTIKKIMLGGRGTYFCPACQR